MHECCPDLILIVASFWMAIYILWPCFLNGRTPGTSWSNTDRCIAEDGAHRWRLGKSLTGILRWSDHLFSLLNSFVLSQDNVLKSFVGFVWFEHVFVCSYTDPVISMDLLRTVLQPSFNEDIRAVFRKYMKVTDRSCYYFGTDCVCLNCSDHVFLHSFLRRRPVMWKRMLEETSSLTSSSETLAETAWNMYNIIYAHFTNIYAKTSGHLNYELIIFCLRQSSSFLIQRKPLWNPVLTQQWR